MKLIEKAGFAYLKYRHVFSPVLFILGFALDLSIVKKPDSLSTIVFISTHFALTLILILLTGLAADRDIENSPKAKWNPLLKIFLEILLQFTFGALASSLFVLYFKGSDYIASLPFLIILAIFLFGNEFAHKHTSRFEVRFVSTIVLAYAYLIYLIPLYRNKLGDDSLIISSIVSILIAGILFLFIRKIAPYLFAQTKTVLIYSMIGLFIGLPSLIYFDIIPPLPLMLREGSVVYSVEKEYGSEYHVEIESTPIYKRLGIPLISPTYKVEKNSNLMFFTAIYAPSDINTDIIHVWKLYDPSTREYVERSKITLKVSGGRENGFRTYSMISNVEEGVWRVMAELGTGQVLGHRDFKVIRGTPELTKDIK